MKQKNGHVITYIRELQIFKYWNLLTMKPSKYSPKTMSGQRNKNIDIHSHIKELIFSHQSSTSKTRGESSHFLIFANTEYKLHIINTAEPLPYHTISLQNQINHFEILSTAATKHLLVMVRSGKWYGFRLSLANIKEGLKINKEWEGLIEEEERNKTVGVHLLQSQGTVPNLKLMFIKESGKVYYSTLSIDMDMDMGSQGQSKQKSNLKTVKQYRLSSKPDNSLGRNFLLNYLSGNSSDEAEHRDITNHKRITNTALSGQILFCIILDPQTSLYSALSLHLEDYSIKMGMDCLLNLSTRPYSIHVSKNPTAGDDVLLMLNMGSWVLLWDPKNGSTSEYPLIKNQQNGDHYCCYGLKQVQGTPNFQCLLLPFSHIKNCETVPIKCLNLELLHSNPTLKITSNPKKQQEYTNILFQQNRLPPKTSILFLYKHEQQQPHSIIYYILTDKLELHQITPQLQQPSSQADLLIPNLNVQITHSQLIYSQIGGRTRQQDIMNGLLVGKQVGYHEEHMLVTNNRVVGAMGVYQHNMLFKMAEVVHVPAGIANTNSGSFYISSPMLGTQHFILTAQKQQQENSVHQSNNVLTLSTSSKTTTTHYIQEEETLFMDAVCQITSTAVTLFPHNTVPMEELFDGSDVTVLCGCRVGQYVILGLQHQVHVFRDNTKQDKDNNAGKKTKSGKSKKELLLERVCIYCIEQSYSQGRLQNQENQDFQQESTHEQLKFMCPLNNVNMFLLQMWSKYSIICRIQEPDSKSSQGHSKMEVKVITPLSNNPQQQQEQQQQQYISKHIHRPVTINTKQYLCTFLSNGVLVVASNDPLQLYQNADRSQVKIVHNFMPVDSLVCMEIYDTVEIENYGKEADKSRILIQAIHNDSQDNQQKLYLLSLQNKLFIKQSNSLDLVLELEEIVGFSQRQQHFNCEELSSTNNKLLLCVLMQQTIALIGSNKVVTYQLVTGKVSVDAGVQRWVVDNSQYGLRKKLGLEEHGKEGVRVQVCKQAAKKGQQGETIDIIVKGVVKLHKSTARNNNNNNNNNQEEIDETTTFSTDILLYNEKQIWLAKESSQKISLVSYFSFPNNSFLQFKNNLTVSELENLHFMDMFAHKLPIKSVHAFNCSIVVIYDKHLIVLDIGRNQEFMISAEVKLEAEGVLGGIETVFGYGRDVLYMKDRSHRLIQLRHQRCQAGKSEYKIIVNDELEDEIVSLHSINSRGNGDSQNGKKWNNRSFRYMVREQQHKQEKQQEQGEVVMVKKDGQFIIASSINDVFEPQTTKPFYL